MADSLEKAALCAAHEQREVLFQILSGLVQRESENFALPDGTISGHENNCQSLVAEMMRESGLDPDIYSPMDVPGFSQHEAYLPGRHLEERANVSALLAGTAPRQRIMLMAHVDTCPAGDPALWELPPCSGLVRDGWIHGRGSADDKAGIAVFLFALRILQQCGIRLRDDVVLTSYCDEERGGGNGALAACLRWPSDVYVNLDSMDYALIDRAHAGAGWEIRVHQRGNSDNLPVYEALKLVIEAMKLRIPRWSASYSQHPCFSGTGLPKNPLSISHIEIGNDGDSAIGFGKVSFYLRAMLSKEAIIADLEEILDEVRLKLDVLDVDAELVPFARYFPACLNNGPAAATSVFLDAVADVGIQPPRYELNDWWSDLNVIAAYGGGTAFNFGTLTPLGHPGAIHSPNEAMRCDALLDMAYAVLAFLLRWCQGSQQE